MNHTSDVELPSDYLDLLQRPLVAHLATAGPAGRPQVTPMWFECDGSRLRFTHTSQRQKYRNVRRDPRIAVSILDPEQPYRYLELRGSVEAIEPDPEVRFFDRLAERYGAEVRNRPTGNIASFSSFGSNRSRVSRRTMAAVRPTPAEGGPL